jgi:hypothetical protein
MRHIFSGRAYWLIGVALFIGISVYRTPDARAQDTNAASVAELQQRVQDLEAVVRQLKENHDPNPTQIQPVSLSSADPTAGPAAPSAAPLANVTADPPDPPVGGGATSAAENFIGWNNGFFLRTSRCGSYRRHLARAA